VERSPGAPPQPQVKMQPPPAAPEQQQNSAAADSTPIPSGVVDRLLKMKEMTGSMPAYTPAQEKAKREQREAILQVSDPSHVPAAAASEWEHGDGEMEAWVEENFTSLFEPKEKEYHHPVAARATREIKEALEITEKLKEGDSDNWEAVYEAIKTLLTRRVGSLRGRPR
jgi:hypothetical protein